MYRSAPNNLLPSTADITTCPIESPAVDSAKTDTSLPTIYHQLKNKPFKWVNTLENKTIIVNPSDSYRQIQTKIKFHLERTCQPSRYSLYAVKGAFKRLESLRGFYDILVVDLRSAYNHITYTRICGILRSRGIEPAHEWAKYCVFNGSLMRGSICSNQILESLIIRLDYRLAGLARQQNFFMKRYTDEYWFYGDFQGKNLKRFLSHVRKAAHAEGFPLNSSKTYIEHRSDIETFMDG